MTTPRKPGRGKPKAAAPGRAARAQGGARPAKRAAPPAAKPATKVRAAKTATGGAAKRAGRPRLVDDATLATILRELHRTYPDAHTALLHENPLELLIATILSAQSTDERVNIVTRALFQKYRDVAAYAAADPAELEQDIHSTGFFRNKTKSVLGAARRIQERHGGRVPETMEELVELPGVARKTANVVLGSAFGKAEGVVVDTHVSRVSFRLGMTLETDPVKIERDLVRRVPRADWIYLAHALIYHGRQVCIARKPRCSECPLRAWCPRNGVTVSA